MKRWMIAFLLPLTAHAGFFNFGPKDPPQIEIVPAFNAKAEPIDRAVPITIRAGDVIRIAQFKGEAFKILKAAKRDARRASTIRGVDYFNERGTDRAWDQRAADAFDRAMSLSPWQTLTAGRDIKLLRLKKLLETTRRFTTPNDGVTYMRDYFVPVAILDVPIQSGATEGDCHRVLESSEMLAREREALNRR